jgi:hypothetical protein
MTVISWCSVLFREGTRRKPETFRRLLINCIQMHLVSDGNETYDFSGYEKTIGTIKNGQSRDNGNIGHKRHRMKTNKTKKTKHNRT